MTAPFIDRCTCGSWRADGLCHTCAIVAARQLARIQANLAATIAARNITIQEVAA